MSIDTIRSDFALLDEWEDRYRYVIELGRALPPLAPSERSEATKVRGCASQVWLVSEQPEGPGPDKPLRFRGESDAHIVQGLIAILLAAVADKTPREIAGLEPQAVFDELGLKEHLTPQRSNGLASMIKRIKADAAAALA